MFPAENCVCFVCVLLVQKEKYPTIFHPYYAPLENIPCDYFSGHNWTFMSKSTTLLQYVQVYYMMSKPSRNNHLKLERTYCRIGNFRY